MKRDEEKVAKLLKGALPSDERMELARARALERLRAASASGKVPEDPDWNRPVRVWWQAGPIWLAPVLVTALAALVLVSIPIARRFVANVMPRAA